MNLKTLDENIIKNLSIWLKTSPEEIKSLGEILPAEPNSYYEGLLDLEILSQFEGNIRRFVHKIVKCLKEKDKYFVLDTLKKFRQLKRKGLIEISECRFVKLDKILRQKLSLPPIDWNGKKAVICLSHDVDSLPDYQFCDEIFKLNQKYNIKSNFNFLTRGGYKVEPEFLKKLKDNGSEIGLHGYTHDIAIGIRKETRIKKELRLALDQLNIPIFGYRAPAFALTKKVLKVLKELGLKYDSSIKSISCYGQAAETFYPYRYPGIGIWELPLSIQDDRIFRDLHLSCEEGLGVIKEITKRIIDIGGVIVINNHPRLVKQRLYYYTELLEWISKLNNVWVTTPIELINFMEQREKSIPNH